MLSSRSENTPPIDSSSTTNPYNQVCFSSRSSLPVERVCDVISLPPQVILHHPIRLGHDNEPQDAHEFDLEVYQFMRSHELERLPNSRLFEHQATIRPMMRASIIDWLVEMHKSLKMHTDTLFLAVELIDLSLSRTNCSKSKFQVLSCAALLIAAKGDEPHAPRVDKFVYLASNAFTTKELTKTEGDIFKLLDCRVNVVHSSHFMKRFLRLVSPTTKLTMIAHFVNETALLDNELIGVIPSLRAAAVVALSLTLDRGPKQWNDEMKDNTGYSIEDLEPIVLKLLTAIRKFNGSRLLAIHKKYAVAPLCSVSELEYPESLQLE
jgi:hypothetical protein